MSTLETRSWNNPDDVQTPDKTHAASIKLGECRFVDHMVAEQSYVFYKQCKSL
jgi:hypothetical protein